jgi:hypothetical protein
MIYVYRGLVYQRAKVTIYLHLVRRRRIVRTFYLYSLLRIDGVVLKRTS